MKKKLIIGIVALLLGNCNLFAQRDGFFSTDYKEYREDVDWGIDMPLLPGSHGGLGDYNCIDQTAPLGSGLSILVGLGFAYMVRRRKEK